MTDSREGIWKGLRDYGKDETLLYNLGICFCPPYTSSYLLSTTLEVIVLLWDTLVRQRFPLGLGRTGVHGSSRRRRLETKDLSVVNKTGRKRKEKTLDSLIPEILVGNRRVEPLRTKSVYVGKVFLNRTPTSSAQDVTPVYG